MNEHQLLSALVNFLTTKQIVQGDKDSLLDMVKRYKAPPISMAFPVALRMSVADSHKLNDLLRQALIVLANETVTPKLTSAVQINEKFSNDD